MYFYHNFIRLRGKPKFIMDKRYDVLDNRHKKFHFYFIIEKLYVG